MKYFLLPLFLTNCVTTEKALPINKKIFNTESGTRVIVGYLTSEEGLYAGGFKNGPNEEFISYPEMARRAGIEGIVQLFVEVSETGEVTDVKVTRGIGGGCDKAAWQTMKNSKFTPAKDANLNRVSAKHYISVAFKL